MTGLSYSEEVFHDHVQAENYSVYVCPKGSNKGVIVNIKLKSSFVWITKLILEHMFDKK